MNPDSNFKPYYAVVFTSTRLIDDDEYQAIATLTEELAKTQKGYLGYESAGGKNGISVSYWETLEDIKNWKLQQEHIIAQQKGITEWYQYYKVRICKVEREYEFFKS